MTALPVPPDEQVSSFPEHFSGWDAGAISPTAALSLRQQLAVGTGHQLPFLTFLRPRGAEFQEGQVIWEELEAALHLQRQTRVSPKSSLR